MSIGPHEVMRAEREDGFSAPAHVIPDSSLDCGCKQFPCPKLAQYATRKVYLLLLCLIGTIQGAVFIFLHVTSSTISRKFHIYPLYMDWLLVTSEIIPFFAALGISYWGNRIHRAAWIGALVLLQSVTHFMLFIPHFTQETQFREETENSTSKSLYPEDSLELCKEISVAIVPRDDGYIFFYMLGVAQIFTGMANVAYYGFGISYLDDNTKRRHVPTFIGLILAAKMLGITIGYFLAWPFLKIDEEHFNAVDSYREQIGGWWFGWPILSILLAIPALALTIFPRQLLSEMVEQAANTILNASRMTITFGNTTGTKVGKTRFLPSMLRIGKNKILMFNVLATAVCSTAIINFIASENMFMESNFHVPRPTGRLLGYSDPLVSRAIITILKPLLAGAAMFFSGQIISMFSPKTKFLAGYNVIAVFLTGFVILLLTLNSCNLLKVQEGGDNSLIQHCNYDCRCSKDANFVPVCDASNKFIFYSACYAGCASSEYKDGERSYYGCKCVKEMTENFAAIEGPCGSDCQTNWIIFEIVTLFTYTVMASIIVGDVLINLRSSYTQDKALVLGFWMMWMAVFTYVPGKLVYKEIADSACIYWGSDRQLCRLHNSSLGSRLCFLTAGLLILGGILKIIVFIFSSNVEIFDQESENLPEERELQDMSKTQIEPLLSPAVDPVNPSSVEVECETYQTSLISEPKTNNADVEYGNQPFTYGPLGPGDRRTDPSDNFSKPNSIYAYFEKIVIPEDPQENAALINKEDSSSDESTIGKDSTPKIPFKPLELDSEFESDLTTSGPRSRKRLPSKEKNIEFPNPDNYEDLREYRAQVSKKPKFGSKKNLSDSQGDFNQLGIPEDPNYEGRLIQSKIPMNKSNDPITLPFLHDPTNKMAQSEVPKELTESDRIQSRADGPFRPRSRDQASSGFGSLPDVTESTVPYVPRIGDSVSKGSLTSRTSESPTEGQKKRTTRETNL